MRVNKDLYKNRVTPAVSGRPNSGMGVSAAADVLLFDRKGMCSGHGSGKQAEVFAVVHVLDASCNCEHVANLFKCVLQVKLHQY